MSDAGRGTDPIGSRSRNPVGRPPRPEPHPETPPVVILAAGKGERLGMLTAQRPKAMLDVGGGPLLGRALSALEGAGFERALIVAGHAADVIDAFLQTWSGAIGRRVVHNLRYAVTNNIVSLLTASDELGHGFCLMNSDIIFEPGILHDLRTRDRGVWLVVDRDEPLGDEEMKVEATAAGLVRRISKRLPPDQCIGEYIGIARFDARGASAVVEAARRLVAGGGEHLYYEDAIDAAAPLLKARMLFTDRRPWTEVDDLADYERARRVAAQIDQAAAE